MKKLTIALLILFLITGVSAFSYDFERSTVLDRAEDSAITFSGLNPDTQYSFRRDGGREIKTFTTSTSGAAQIEFTFKPVDDKVSLTKNGFPYEVTSTSAPDKSFNLYPSLFLSEFDHFTDSTIYYDLVDFDSSDVLSVSESGTELQAVNGFGGLGSSTETIEIEYKRNLSTGKAAKFNNVYYESKPNSGSQTDLRARVVFDGYGTLRLYSESSDNDGDTVKVDIKDVTAYYNKTDDKFTVDYIVNGNDKNKSLTGFPNVDAFNVSLETYGNFPNGGESVTVAADSIATIPKSTKNKYNFSGSFGFEPTAGPLNYEFYKGAASFRDGPLMKYVGYYPRGPQGSFKSLLDNVGTWNAIASINTDNGTADYLTMELNDAGIFQELKPADEKTLTDNKATFSYKYNAGDNSNWISGLAFSDTGANYSLVPAKWDSTGSCKVDSGDTFVKNVKFVGSECVGETIEATVNIAAYADKTYWSFGLEETVTGSKTYASEVRYFDRLIADTNVDAITPLNGTTLTTLKPRFVGFLNSGEPGTLELQVDNTVLNPWILRQRTTGNFAYKPSTGLTNGNHTYQYVFDGVAGGISSSDLVNFSINTSLSNELNVSLIEPVNDSQITTGDVKLKYNVESGSSANADVYLNQEKITEKNIDPGDANYTTEIRDLSAGSYNWFVTVNKSNVIYQSELGSFRVTNNVTLNPDKPESGASIDSPPIVFNGSYSSTAGGTLSLLIDGTVRERKDKDKGNATYEFVVDQDISDGKHTYRIQYVTDNGETFTSTSRTFNLELGTTDDGVVAGGGMLRSFANTFIANPLGISATAATYMLTLLLSLIVGVLGAVTVSQREGTVFALISFSVLTVFSIAGLFPVWVPVGMIILGAGIVAFKGFGGG